jgi:hypothetical protein
LEGWEMSEEIKSESDKKYYENRLKELVKKELDLEYDIPTPITLAMLVFQTS